MKNVRLLHLEDDPLDARAMRLCLSNPARNYKLDQVGTLSEGAKCFEVNRYDAVLLDLSLPDCYGSHALKQARQYFADVPVIIVTGNNDQVQAESFVDLGADDYLFKSELNSAAIWKSIIYAIRKKQLERTLHRQTCELKLATELEKRANKSKTEFLANVSHDLRTPLGVVLGYAEILEGQEGLSEEALNYVQRIMKTTNGLVDLVNDLLDLSKVETGHFEVHQRETNLIDELNEAMENYAFKTEEKGIAFEVSYDTSLPTSVYMDRLRVRQILDNLVGNAIKFTSSGSIKVLVSAKILPLVGILTFEVYDTGPGIGDDAKDKIFEPFQQENSGISTHFGGTGLGLALSKKLATALGGRVELIETKVGKGSCFRFTLPVEIPLAGEDVNKSSSSIQPSTTGQKYQEQKMSKLVSKKVLLAEDNLDNQLLFTQFLHTSGFSVDIAENGQIAVEKAQSGQYGVILMDMQMPVMSGGDAVKELRRRGYKGFIIALTAYAMAEEKDHCLKIGCNDFLSKPVSRKDLQAKILHYLEPQLHRTLSSDVGIEVFKNPQIER